MEYLYLLAGLVLILAGANYLTDGSVALAERFRVPGFLIGLTIVAVGTSTPELVVSFLSALEGQGDMAVGNVVGSNLFNVFIILGVCALCRSRGRTSGATCPSASRRRWCSAPCWPTRCSTRRIRHASAASRDSRCCCSMY